MRVTAAGVQRLSDNPRLRAAVAGVDIIESASVMTTTAPSTSTSTSMSSPASSAKQSAKQATAEAAAGQRILRRLAEAVWSSDGDGGSASVSLAPEEEAPSSRRSTAVGRAAAIVGADILHDVEIFAAAAGGGGDGCPMQAALGLLARALSAAEAAHCAAAAAAAADDDAAEADDADNDAIRSGGGADGKERGKNAAGAAAPGALDLPPFEALCVCLHESWPRALPSFVWQVAAAKAAEAAAAAEEEAETKTGTKKVSTRATRRKLARRALHVLNPSPPRRQRSGGGVDDDEARARARARTRGQALVGYGVHSRPTREFTRRLSLVTVSRL